MNEKKLYLMLALAAGLLVYPFYDSIVHDARSMDDLTMVSRVLVGMFLGVFAWIMWPLFAWIWKMFADWINGK